MCFNASAFTAPQSTLPSKSWSTCPTIAILSPLTMYKPRGTFSTPASFEKNSFMAFLKDDIELLIKTLEGTYNVPSIIGDDGNG
mmetsp:Transcript_7741/g.12320  ORF Transcript_7741/g.12320 Transcript_7741/m.12320 type:complete len:84 (+) Transcript_7741:143-394(+)